MTKKQVHIQNVTGLHARPASEFVAAAQRYAASITVGIAGEAQRADAKSIVMVLGLGIDQNATVELTANGPDETEAAEALAALIAAGFGEG